jgi:fumarate hydratase class I
MPQPLQIDLVDHGVELIRRASTVLPPDVKAALERARAAEAAGSASQQALATILENVAMAEADASPVCQDTGTLIFYVDHPFGYSTAQMMEQLNRATVIASEKAYLRPNAVDSVTGKNSGNNLGLGFPQYHIHEWNKEEIRIRLLLKGGGSENVCAQYSLPDDRIKAGRTLDGVRKAVLDAVCTAQGQGCSPGVIGVCIGGDRGAGYVAAKEQLFRHVDDVNPDPALAGLERQLLAQLNELGIGPMGFGGTTTVFGVKIGALHRLPACFFVSVAYLCWAARRAVMTIANGEVRYDA